MAKLTEKQKLFCENYLMTMNAVDAYLAVYKNCKSRDNASKHASRLLALPHIRAYVDTCLEKAHSNKVADIQEVMEYLTSVMRGETSAEEVMVVGTGEGCSEPCKVSKAPSEKERLKAAELIGKRYALFTGSDTKEDDADSVVIVNDAPK
jgi:phage terminase small subunit